MFQRLCSGFVPVIAVCGVFFVAGCALPPVIAIASYAATGLSYVSSGKSVSDHVLSAMVEQDCAMFRVVMGEDICHAQGDQPVDGVVIASAEEFKPWEIEPAAGSAHGDSNSLDERGDEQGNEPDDGTGDYFDNANTVLAPMLAQAVTRQLKGVLLEGLALGTEIFALMQDDGALEIYAHDPALVGAPENIRMILKVDGYAQRARSVEGVRLNGIFYAISDILV
jgi:hypothetical protein